MLWILYFKYAACETDCHIYNEALHQMCWAGQECAGPQAPLTSSGTATKLAPLTLRCGLVNGLLCELSCETLLNMGSRKLTPDQSVTHVYLTTTVTMVGAGTLGLMSDVYSRSPYTFESDLLLNTQLLLQIASVISSSKHRK
jgi:hypothetical protein